MSNCHKRNYSVRKEKNNHCISLHCFINVEDLPSVSTKFSYSPTSITCNDNTETIKLTLWVSCINYVNESNVYSIQQEKVTEWLKAILSITTTPSRSIKPSKETIIKSKSVLKELISYSVQFPPTSFRISSFIKWCPECGKSLANMKGILFTYEHCKEMTQQIKQKSSTSIFWNLYWKADFKMRWQCILHSLLNIYK